MNRSLNLAGPVLGLALGLGGCSRTEADPSLRRFESCGELEAYMKEMAEEEVREAWSQSGGGRGGVFKGGSNDLAVQESAAPTSAGDGPASHTGTNLQEEGVDEDDLVKTDGEYLYALGGQHLVITRAWPVEAAEQVGSLEIGGTPVGLYLLEDGVTAVVLSQHDPWYTGKPTPLSGAEPSRQAVYTGVTLVDLSDRSAPAILRETFTTGELKESRRIDDRLFVVTYEDIQVGDLAGSRREALDRVEAAGVNRFLPLRQDNILAAAQDWLAEEARGCGCTDVWGSDRYGGTFVTQVSSLDLSDPDATFVGTGVVGRADVVYMSPEALYLGYSEWDEGAFGSRDDHLDTVLHKFDISDEGAQPTYVASGSIRGVLSDQFALSERDGVLRVATTVTDNGDDLSGWSSSVWTLSPDQSGGFVTRDRAQGLAPGEEIYAARFVGELGFLVTYEVQLGDPLFTIDLSDPDNIDVRGELHITGFSDYIHPMGEDHLLTVGLDDGGGAHEWGLAVSLFDVSDLDNPTLADRVVLDAWGSEAQSEHHAFTWSPENGTLAIPSWGEDSGSLEVLSADPEAGLAHVGTLAQDTVASSLAEPWCATMRRSVMMEDVVWALGSAGATAAELAAPSVEVAAVPYEGVEACGAGTGWD